MLEQRSKRAAEYPQRLIEFPALLAKYKADVARWESEVRNVPEFLAKIKAWEVEKAKAIHEGTIPPPEPRPSEKKPKAPELPEGGPESPFMIGSYYNAMIAPLIPYAIKGVIWYQGESNGDKSKQYEALFPILIKSWREAWKQGEFPFLFVQLANNGKPATLPVEEADVFPGVREAQAKALSVPNTGMAVTVDIGDPSDVHSRDKYHVGLRLSLLARHHVYGEDLVFSGPTYDSMKINGKQIELSFKNRGSGLMIDTPPWVPFGKIPPVASELKGFAIAGADKKWVWANAKIRGEVIVVESPQVPAPVAVRYGWANNPPCNLYNKEKLPASPFRTDQW